MTVGLRCRGKGGPLTVAGLMVITLPGGPPTRIVDPSNPQLPRYFPLRSPAAPRQGVETHPLLVAALFSLEEKLRNPSNTRVAVTPEVADWPQGVKTLRDRDLFSSR